MHRSHSFIFLALLSGCCSIDNAKEPTKSETPKLEIFIQRLALETVPFFKVEGVPLVTALEKLGGSWEAQTGTDWPVVTEDIGSKDYPVILEIRDVSYYDLLQLLSEVSGTHTEFTPENIRFFKSGEVVCVTTYTLVLGEETTGLSGLPPGSGTEAVLNWLHSFLTEESVAYVSSVEKMGPDRFLIIGNDAAPFETVKSLCHLIQRGIKVTPSKSLPKKEQLPPPNTSVRVTVDEG